MELRIARRLFTVDEYEQMGRTGILGKDDRVELIEGEIVEMDPIGIRHASCVTRLATLLVRCIGGRAVVYTQTPVLLDVRSEPLPDVVVLAPSDDLYESRRAGPADVLWLVEVADTTLAYDRRIKVPLYARAGVAEVWIVDLENDRVEVFAEPVGSDYHAHRAHERGERVSPRDLSRVVLSVAEILD